MSPAVRLIVNVPVLVPGSLAEASVATTVTVGLSSSVMLAVTCCVPDSRPFVTALTSTMMVSLASSVVSWTAVSVTAPVVEPGLTTMLTPLRV